MYIVGVRCSLRIHKIFTGVQSKMFKKIVFYDNFWAKKLKLGIIPSICLEGGSAPRTPRPVSDDDIVHYFSFSTIWGIFHFFFLENFLYIELDPRNCRKKRHNLHKNLP